MLKARARARVERRTSGELVRKAARGVEGELVPQQPKQRAEARLGWSSVVGDLWPAGSAVLADAPFLSVTGCGYAHPVAPWQGTFLIGRDCARRALPEGLGVKSRSRQRWGHRGQDAAVHRQLVFIATPVCHRCERPGSRSPCARQHWGKFLQGWLTTSVVSHTAAGLKTKDLTLVPHV